ncbi:MAG TPA: SpoIIE family protein phosphatase [Streptosporangiaceae bacterium]
MSTDTSVPQPRVSGLDVSDSALLATLLREAPIGFAFFGPDLRIRRINQTLAGLDGLDLEAHVGLLPSQVWSGSLASRAESAVRHVLAEGQPLYESNQPVTPAEASAGPAAEPAPPSVANGDQRSGTDQPRDDQPRGDQPRGDQHWAFSWFPSHDPEGNVAGVALIAVDVTDRQNSQEAVRRSEERYRSLVQAGAQVVWVTTPTGQIAEDSPEWRWITGQSLEEYLGNGWLDAIHPEDRERVDREWRECVQVGKVFDSRYRVRTKTGAYRHYDVRAVPIERDGKIIEWVGASTDVTGQREAEEMRGRLTEQLSAAALRTARLQQATSMLAEALTVLQVVEVITEVGRSAIGAERSAVALLDRERLRLRTINPGGLPDVPGTPPADLPLDTPSVMTLAITTRRPVLVENPESLRRHFDGVQNVDLFLAHSDERAWVGLPLLAAGAPLGALRFSFTKPRRITEEERVFLEALAGQCALALERASLFEREHTTAETLQRSLLPDRLPNVPGIILEARYLPVTRNMEIGGDWYDAFRLADGRLAVAAGDVMGKGLTAAAGMGRVRNALRALALTDPRPAAVLAGLDRLFTATELDEQVTTVAYLVVDPVTGEGLAGNAGHLPPLLLSRDAPPRLDTTEAGTPLGWACPRQQYVFRLPPGTTAVLYSDGLVENRRRGLDAGLDELVSVAAQARPGMVEDPARLLEYLVDRMLTGYEQDDDVTVLVLHVPRRDGPPADRGSGGVIPAARRGKV